MANAILKKALDTFRVGDELPSPDTEPFFDALIAETDETLLAGLLTAWDQKGITENEIYSIAKIMRERCIKVKSRHETFVDIVGTGGSKAKTFNVSTAAAFVVAGAGIPVAKHGNKAATSNSGSADVLSALGIEPAVDAIAAERCLNKIGICFMFAPNFHRLSPFLAKVRRGLGFPTIFNCVGPLCNPAFAPHKLIGVWDKSLVPKMANALARLGTKKSWVVHGGGLDEISLSGPTVVAEVANESVNVFEITPADFGVRHVDLSGVKASDASESAAMIRGVLNGTFVNTTAVNLVALNAAAAINLVSTTSDLAAAFANAIETISSGAARGKLDAMIDLTNR